MLLRVSCSCRRYAGLQRCGHGPTAPSIDLLFTRRGVIAGIGCFVETVGHNIVVSANFPTAPRRPTGDWQGSGRVVESPTGKPSEYSDKEDSHHQQHNCLISHVVRLYMIAMTIIVRMIMRAILPMCLTYGVHSVAYLQRVFYSSSYLSQGGKASTITGQLSEWWFVNCLKKREYAQSTKGPYFPSLGTLFFGYRKLKILGVGSGTWIRPFGPGRFTTRLPDSTQDTRLSRTRLGDLDSILGSDDLPPATRRSLPRLRCGGRFCPSNPPVGVEYFS